MQRCCKNYCLFVLRDSSGNMFSHYLESEVMTEGKNVVPGLNAVCFMLVLKFAEDPWIECFMLAKIKLHIFLFY